MTLIQFLEGLLEIDGPMMLSLSPGPFSLSVGEEDRKAAEFLLGLHLDLPPEATMGEVSRRVLMAAIVQIDPEIATGGGDWYTDQVRALMTAWWWLVFWTAQPAPAPGVLLPEEPPLCGHPPEDIAHAHDGSSFCPWCEADNLAIEYAAQGIPKEGTRRESYPPPKEEEETIQPQESLKDDGSRVSDET